MARSSFSFRAITFIHHKSFLIRPTLNTQIRKLSVESKEIALGSQGSKPSLDQENPFGENQQFTQVAREVADITRRHPRWEGILLSRFGSFNFANPQFFGELLKHQDNVFFSLMFFRWLLERHNFVPDQVSSNVLFGLLLDAKAYGAAKWFLDVSGFSPEPDSLERYAHCLCEGGMIQDAFDVFSMFKEVGVCLPMATWNAGLSAFVKARRTDLFWRLYQYMIECGAVADIDAETIKHMIHAFCADGQEVQGYELFKQVLEDGIVPTKTIFDDLISVFCKKGDYFKVSEILHLMIARNLSPDWYTYQQVINGLWKSKMVFEAMRIFNEVKDRGYKPDRVMYTTMIHGLGQIGWLADARRLWFEMLNKGIEPNEYAYNALIHGYYKNGDPKMAMKLFEEMRDQGFGETTESYNMMISGLSSCRQPYKAFQLFEEMKEKGIACDVISYNALIASFSRAGKMIISKKLLKELLAQGLQPTTTSYLPIIKWLCKKAKMQRAKKMWNEMLNWDLEPKASDYDLFVSGLCQKGYASEGLEWLVAMLNKKHKPQKTTFERLLRCLLGSNRLDEVLLILNYMYSAGYGPGDGMCNYLVRKFCNKNRNFVQPCLGKILEIN